MARVVEWHWAAGAGPSMFPGQAYADLDCTKRALELGRRRYLLAEKIAKALGPLGGGMLPAWHLVLALERAAIAVGIERERGRQAKRKGPRR